MSDSKTLIENIKFLSNAYLEVCHDHYLLIEENKRLREILSLYEKNSDYVSDKLLEMKRLLTKID